MNGIGRDELVSSEYDSLREGRDELVPPKGEVTSAEWTSRHGGKLRATSLPVWRAPRRRRLDAQRDAKPRSPSHGKVRRHPSHEFEPKRLDRLGANVSDRFFHGIRCVDEIQIAPG